MYYGGKKWLPSSHLILRSMPATDAPPPPRFCSSCKTNKPETREHFALKNGALDRTCIKCQTSKAKKKTAERVDSDADPSDKENEAISMDEDCRTFGAFTDAAVLAKSGRGLADAIAKEIFDAIGYVSFHTQYEMFSILGEVAGSGSPLGYLLIKYEKGSEPGGTQKYTAAVLAHLRGSDAPGRYAAALSSL
ncbi:hypothetical protein K438DRAFT_1749365 [Mycena galopus ATCC 62051]|nr:hypothetical protein K438DRAFT_1749365 [Mycena galopus ATCC 62051]